MSSAGKERAQREALRVAASRPPSLQEPRSEILLRRYLAAAIYAAVRGRLRRESRESGKRA
jgi:hypothetical protein